MKIRLLPSAVATALLLSNPASYVSSAVDLGKIDYEIKPGILTPGGRRVSSPYVQGRPFPYLNRIEPIQPPLPPPPKYLVLDKYTPKYFWLPDIAPAIYQNGDRYGFSPPVDLFRSGDEIGIHSSQFLNLGVMSARYVPQAIAPPIRAQGGDLDEDQLVYDPSAPPEFLFTGGWQSSDVFKAIDKTSEAGFPIHGPPDGDEVRRTPITYAKGSVAFKGFAFTATYLESLDSIRPRETTETALADGEERLRQELRVAESGGPVATELLKAANLLGGAVTQAEKGRLSERAFEKLEPLLLRYQPPMENYREVDLSLNYSHEIVPRLFDGTVGYTAYFNPDPSFFGTGYAGELYGTVVYKQIPHVRPSVTFSLFNSAVPALRGKYVDFRCETYALTILKSKRFEMRAELNPYVAIGLDDGFIGDGADWSAVQFGVRAPIYIGRHAVLNLDVNYAIPINGHSDSTSNFRTDLGEVGPWGGVSMSIEF